MITVGRQCSSRQSSSVTVLQGGNSPGGHPSWRATLQAGTPPGGQLSRRATLQAGNSPGGQLSRASRGAYLQKTVLQKGNPPGTVLQAGSSPVLRADNPPGGQSSRHISWNVPTGGRGGGCPWRGVPLLHCYTGILLLSRMVRCVRPVKSLLRMLVVSNVLLPVAMSVVSSAKMKGLLSKSTTRSLI